MNFKIPEVSQADIVSFHASHFSAGAIESFHTHFLRPENTTHGYDENDYGYGYEEEENDDGLGYYSDGVKRTLTDEQIAIFRHSELEAFRKAQEEAAAKPRPEDTAEMAADTPTPPPQIPVSATPATGLPTPSKDDTTTPTKPNDQEEDNASEEGEIETDRPVYSKADWKRLKRLKARHRRAETRKFNPEKKPDLRKRTWDVVEAGMDSLDYDDLEGAGAGVMGTTAKRRQISYDD
ncbi:hypothetical protein F5Y16DRAFT_136701 [Xylariaceae sp. FL0255]|nr:hypothetical protein F5Y16DRAFT_136701 [Xylariaceae sp. FL0255]